ncbi:hypothetical protein [Saccharopolyspora gloriosae]|uniref:hypothetical protein n=1 Tax=Saccharopolyspora gloriosae TaxID=455344 RepID=UPI001FB690FD|nr:hypothetical protein [Saccharopolyspora gloriosae]
MFAVLIVIALISTIPSRHRTRAMRGGTNSATSINGGFDIAPTAKIEGETIVREPSDW